MKRIALTICSATLLFISCNNSGDEKKENTMSADTSKKTADVKTETAAPPAPVDSATMMKNWMACMTPGEMHKMMASWDGTWNADITMWEPGKPPTKTTGKAVNKMILGGRYQESLNTGNMMGMPFEGHGTLGYNNATKMFENTWVDNMGTGVMTMKGPWDAATKTVNLTGKGVDPATMTEKDYRETFTVIDDKTQLMQMFGPGPDGKEMKMMEIKFSRK